MLLHDSGTPRSPDFIAFRLRTLLANVAAVSTYPVLERVRSQTAIHRRVADADRLALTDGSPTTERYASYLVRMYGLQAPLESALVMTPGLADRIDLTLRSYTGSIMADLLALGLPLERVLELPLRPCAPIRSMSDALGWLYVAEQNRTGHQLLRRDLARKLPRVLDGSSLEWPPVTKQEWSELGDMMEEVCQADPTAANAIVDAAIVAYDTQHRWIRPERPTGSDVCAGLHHARATLATSSRSVPSQRRKM